MRIQEYKTEEITVRFDPSICIHSGNCVRGLRQVFDIKKRPWVSINGATAEEIKTQIDQCPSGALTYEVPVSK